MHGWQLWKRGETLKTLEGISPLLASWNSKTDPAQIRLQKYLSEIAAALQSNLPANSDLFLHLEIDIQNPARLLRHYDLENYLTPVVNRLGARQFKLVSAQKRVGGGSRISIGIATIMSGAELDGWQHFSCTAGSGPQTLWKTRLRESILVSQPTLVSPGPVEVHLAWRCGTNRNWVGLWKPTGDAMGPILGQPVARNPFDPDDGRVVSLGLHLNTDRTVGHSVDVGIWWRPVSTEALDIHQSLDL